MSDIAQCLACGADFVPAETFTTRGSPQVYCKTKRCMRDRDMETKARYYAKLKPEIRREILGNPDSGFISAAHCKGGRRRQPREDI